MCIGDTYTITHELLPPEARNDPIGYFMDNSELRVGLNGKKIVFLEVSYFEAEQLEWFANSIKQPGTQLTRSSLQSSTDSYVNFRRKNPLAENLWSPSEEKIKSSSRD